MNITAELSLYPFDSDYITIIKAFIERLNTDKSLAVETTATSTRISGDYAAVFALVQGALQASFEEYGRQVLVCKFIPQESD